MPAASEVGGLAAAKPGKFDDPAQFPRRLRRQVLKPDDSHTLPQVAIGAKQLKQQIHTNLTIAVHIPRNRFWLSSTQAFFAVPNRSTQIGARAGPNS